MIFCQRCGLITNRVMCWKKYLLFPYSQFELVLILSFPLKAFLFLQIFPEYRFERVVSEFERAMSMELGM